MTGEVAIRAENLRKHYGERVALDGVGFSVRAGEIVGLVGPNGAGKTTTLSILAGVLAADSGSASIGGCELTRDPAVARRALGFVPQSIALYPSFTARQNLYFFARIQGLGAAEAATAADAALLEAGLADRANESVAGFSGGMKRRLNLVCGVVHRPLVLLLDEPTVGVDPQSRERIFSMVEASRQRGAAVLYSTHYMEEAERLCDRIILIDHGRIAAEGTPQEVVALAGGEPRIEIVTRNPMPSGWIGGLAGLREEAQRPDDDGRRVRVTVARLDLVVEVIRRAEEAGGGLTEFHLHRPNLQDAFIKLTGHALRDTP